MKKAIIYSTLSLLLMNVLFANDLVPGKQPIEPVALIGGTVHTVSGEVIENGTVIFHQGKITAVGGKEIRINKMTKTIDVSGKHIYPGLILPVSMNGLAEIGAVRATRDFAETGDINPNIVGHVAFNIDSEVLPTVRSNGISVVQVMPAGGLLSGTSSLMWVDGWTREDALIRERVGIHLNFPRQQHNYFIEDKEKRKKAEQQDRAQMQLLQDTFEQARRYYRAKKAGSDIPNDLRWEAMMPLFAGEIPLFIHANRLSEIRAAIDFAHVQAVRMVLVGGGDAWRCSDQLAAQNIPVILRSVHSLPMRHEDGYDEPYRLASRLHEAGVKFCFSGDGFFGAWNERNLSYEAGTAVGHGLPKDLAIRGLTLSAAEILGVADQLGSIETGKSATLIVTAGDVLDMASSTVLMEFVDGKPVDLDNRHKRLYRKYQQRYGLDQE